MAKNLPASAGDVGFIPGAGWSPGEGNGNPLQYSCLGNSMDRGAGRLQSIGSQKSQMQLTKQRDWDLNTTHSVIQLSQTGLKWDSFSSIYSPMSHITASAAAAKSLQSCLTLCDPIDRSPPGSPVPGILQARTLEWVAISFSNAWKWKGKVKSLSRVWPSATPWTAAYQAPPSMGFSRQEYWSGVPLPSLPI